MGLGVRKCIGAWGVLCEGRSLVSNGDLGCVCVEGECCVKVYVGARDVCGHGYIKGVGLR